MRGALFRKDNIMKEIIVMGSPLVLTAGILKLTEKQVRARQHCLKPYFDSEGKRVEDCYEIVAETCFKIGETIYYAGDAAKLRPDIAKDLSAKEEVADLQGKLDELTAYVTSLEDELKKKDEHIAALEAAASKKKPEK